MKKTLKLDIPRQLELLCELWETSPETIIQAFIYDAALHLLHTPTEGRDMATNYLLRCGYGMHSYTYGQTVEIIKELTVIILNSIKYDNPWDTEYQGHLKESLDTWYKKWNQVKNGQTNNKQPS